MSEPLRPAAGVAGSERIAFVTPRATAVGRSGVGLAGLTLTRVSPKQPHGGARRLRIVMVAPPYFSVPPVAYGGIEAVVADLIDSLVGRGHEVTLIGVGRHVGAAPGD
jgi:hypothetical protein